MDYGLICVFATNKLEPHGCCEAVISEASVKYRRELDSQISERFNSVLNREEIEELEGRPDHEDLIYRLCPQPRCAKLIQSSTSSTPYTRSSPKILRCTHCRKDMCLICNDIIHTPTPYCNMLTLMGNLFRIGMLKSILLVLHGTDYGDIISSLNEDDDGEFWARCKVCFDEILRDVCSEPEFKKQD